MTLPDWYLDEIPHAGDEHLDTDYVQQYDEKAQTDPSGDLNILLEHGLNSSHTLIDLGAGTGTFAFAAAQHCQRVIAVDVSPAMVTAMRAKSGHGNIEVVNGGFLSYQHTGEPADFVYSRHALHHLPDFWKVIALQRINTMMKSGGVLFLRDLVYSFQPEEIQTVIDKWLGNASTVAGVGWSRDELVTHLQDEYSPFSWLLETMLEHAGFTIKDVQHGATRVHSYYVCIKK